MKLENTKAYKEYLSNQNSKSKSVIENEKTFHLSYYNGLLTQKEILHFKNKIESQNLIFSSYDKTGDINASLDDFSLSVFYIISEITIQEILKGTLTNATWDAIKYVVSQTWKKIRNKSLIKYTTTKTEKKKIKFGVKIQLDENTNFNFHLDGNLDNETILNALDKILVFISNQERNKEYEFPNYVWYDIKEQNWKKIKFSELIKISKKKKKNSKDK